MRRVTTFIAILAALVGSVTNAGLASADEPEPSRVAIVVGPVGAELTPVYIELAERAAAEAEARGATVARAYSPKATAENVLDAVEGANIVVYFGHGIGSPNPYSSSPNPRTVNGWGLNGRNPSADHADSVRDGNLAYYGEAWIAEHARPAPGWVMVYSNACYAPGAGEGFEEPAAEQTAIARVSSYSRTPLADLGASAYFATDFFAGAATLVATLLDNPQLSFGDVFAADPRFVDDAVTRHQHDSVEGAEVWLHRSPYFEGTSDYWYAFAGNPAATLGTQVPLVGWSGRSYPSAASVPSLGTEDGFVAGMASSYRESAGWEGEATVALPLDLGGGIPSGAPDRVLVCADRCVSLPVVDSCPCYVGTVDQRIANLSHEAWRQVTDLPLEEGLVHVEIFLEPSVVPAGPPGGAPTS